MVRFALNCTLVEDLCFIQGQLQGLSLVLLNAVDANTAAPRINTGFKISLHRQDEVPYNLQDFGVELDMGKHTSVRIKPREVSKSQKI